MPAAPEPRHVLIPDVALPLPPDNPQPPLPELPHLAALLARLRVAATVEPGDDSPATPFEVALARAHGLPDDPGRTPWAAFETATIGRPCGWIVPCHWQMGMDNVTVLPESELGLAEDESRALLAAVQPLLAADGLAVRYQRPDRWLAEGELLRGLTCCSPRRAAQGPIRRDQLGRGASAAQTAHLRRLQSELQMLLYTHPVNDAREQARRWPVNALWFAGAGVLETPHPPDPHVQVESRLSELPAGLDAATWARAWEAIDATTLATLLAAARGGTCVRLTLCGPRRAITLETQRGLVRGIMGRIRPLRLPDLRDQL